MTEQMEKEPSPHLDVAGSICPSCGGDGMSVFYRVTNIPVHSCLLMKDRRSAVSFPRSNLSLAFCPACGFISNQLFDPSVHSYGRIYEESQGYSPCFNSFLNSLAGQLVDKFDIRNKRVLEIGCGKAEFLAAMCRIGNNEGIGIDPGSNPARLPASVKDRVTLICDFYSEAYSDIKADFVCCRHTLEHIGPTRDFLLTVRKSMSSNPGAIAFFEVPDVLRVLRERAFWDIYYEHCSYFSMGSLARLFRSCGFDIIDLELAFDNQYILLTARPSAITEPKFDIERDLDDLRSNVAKFSFMVTEDLELWRRRMQAWSGAGRRVALWGAGSKSVAFLTTLRLDEQIEFICDINPFKQGTFAPGSGHAIVSPDALAAKAPDVVIAMNRIYRSEIASQLEQLGVKTELLEV
jgi:SAM-dependent methyltransferase